MEPQGFPLMTTLQFGAQARGGESGGLFVTPPTHPWAPTASSARRHEINIWQVGRSSPSEEERSIRLIRMIACT